MSRVCVVGAGRWGQNHIKTLKALGHEVSVVDPVVQADYEYLAYMPIDEFDAFTVASTAETHYQLGRHILVEGKPVLIEKPVALSLSDARTLTEIGPAVMAGHLFLFHPAIQKIKEMLPALGQVQFIHSKRLNFGNVRTLEDVIWGSMPHDVSIIDYLMDGEEPLSITTETRTFIQPGIPDGAAVTMQYPNTMVTIQGNWLWPTKEVGLVVICEEGALTFDLKELSLYRNSVSLDRQGRPTLRKGEKIDVPYSPVSPLTAELEYFMGHTWGLWPEIAGKANILQVTRLLEEISNAVRR
jgi:UDP-2-acetamido-3-amino-2,3-dideoxy-glucuronate N-acetyltransferase